MATLRRAQLVWWAVVLVNVAIVEVLYVTAESSDPAQNTLVAIGRFLGLHLALLMILQLSLVARLPWLDRRIGMDRLTSWHRWTGFTLFWVLVLHPTFVLLGYGQADHAPVSREIANLSGQFPVLAGMVAAGVLVLAAGASVRVARRRLQYETWHAVHALTYVAVVLVLIHQLAEGTAFRTSTLAAIYWWTLWTFAIGALLVGRVALPLVRNVRHRFRVAAVVPESDSVVSVYVTGRRLDRLPAAAGQFFVWRFLSRGRWWQANPFSLSAAPDGRSLRLTVKAVGATSAGLRGVPVGTRVYAEGPYGAFTGLQRTRDATLLIAGGVGITPVRALLEDLTGSIVVLYRVHTATDAVLLGELENLARAKHARLVLLPGRTGAGQPPNTPFVPRNLLALVPDIANRDVFVCGPTAMTAAVLRSLRALRVPHAQVHAERFALAG